MIIIVTLLITLCVTSPEPPSTSRWSQRVKELEVPDPGLGLGFKGLGLRA